MRPLPQLVTMARPVRQKFVQYVAAAAEHLTQQGVVVALDQLRYGGQVCLVQTSGTLGTLRLTLKWDGRHTNGVGCCSVLYRLRVFFVCSRLPI